MTTNNSNFTPTSKGRHRINRHVLDTSPILPRCGRRGSQCGCFIEDMKAREVKKTEELRQLCVNRSGVSNHIERMERWIGESLV